MYHKNLNNNTNLVMVVADEMRADSVSHFGLVDQTTPNLDAIASEGLSFSNAYCQNPVCVPSRCSFLSGLYPYTTGHRTMHYLQRPEEPNLLKDMKQAGYEVYWIGRNDVIDKRANKEEYCDVYYDGAFQEGMSGAYYRTDEMIDMDKIKGNYSFYLGQLETDTLFLNYDKNCIQYAIDLIQNRKSDKPFFLYLALTFPHPPYGCEEPWFSSFDRSKLPPRKNNISETKNKSKMIQSIYKKQGLEAMSESQWDELRAVYYGMVKRVDDGLRQVVDALKAKEIYEQTNLIFCSDHGDYTGDYGIVEKAQNCFEDAITKVPLVIKGHHQFTGKVVDHPVELIDLVATVEELCEIELNHTHFSKSLCHYFEDNDKHKEAVFCEGGRNFGEHQAMEKGHLENSPYWPRLNTQEQEDGSHLKTVMLRKGQYKFIYRLSMDHELYDLKEDPNEYYNVYGDEAYQAVVDELSFKVLNHLLETADYVPMKKDLR